MCNGKNDFGKAEMIICIEVAEHILPEHSEILIDNLTNASYKYILFTSANAYNGTGHINVQPPEWWQHLLERRGFDLGKDETKIARLCFDGLKTVYARHMKKAAKIYVKRG